MHRRDELRSRRSKKLLYLALIAGVVALCPAPSQAQSDHSHADHHEGGDADDTEGQAHHGGDGQGSGHAGHDHTRPDSVAPAGVMADHMLYESGSWMISYRFMRMDMAGSRDGTDKLSDEEVLQTPNRFFGRPGQPPTLRIVPTEMTMDMHMFGLMYAASPKVTLMLMASYVDKEMDHTTYKGPVGTEILGTFTTETNGFGDTKVTALYSLGSSETASTHFHLGLSLPTGSITETGTILAPTNMMPTVRVPYAMQLGSGTYDLLAGFTYTGRSDALSWGTQFRSVFRLEGENDQGYAHGDLFGLTGWLAVTMADWVSASARIDGWTLDSISGIDGRIAGPVQTANPDFYGGEQVFGYVGLNTAIQGGSLKGHQLGIEMGWPLYRSLNGPQLETDWTLTASWRKSF